MPERAPRSAENIANQYDEDTLQASDPAALIPWAEARDRLAEGRLFWWATTRPDGQPHVRPVLAVLVDGVLYSTTNPAARKARNVCGKSALCVHGLHRRDRLHTRGDGRTSDRPRHARTCRGDVPLEVRVAGHRARSAFHAPFGAPTAGLLPYQPYALTPYVIFGFGTDETYNLRSTRWRF